MKSHFPHHLPISGDPLGADTAAAVEISPTLHFVAEEPEMPAGANAAALSRDITEEYKKR